MYKLRPYQQEAVNASLLHFKKTKNPAVIVLPTGAGKSLVISELSKISKGRVLILAHVKELVEQNHNKFESYKLHAGIYSAGLNRKDTHQKVIFGSIQSVANANNDFFNDFSLIIVDECHRISIEASCQYQQVIQKIKNKNQNVCILGLTATPYRLGLGFIYEYHYKGFLRTSDPRFFKKCIYELPLSYMIKHKFLTPPVKIDAPVACYDFSSLKIKSQSGKYSVEDIQEIFNTQERITPSIIEHIITMSSDRSGVMIFTSTINHAKEILKLLPSDTSEIIIGDTPTLDRDNIIYQFKNKKLKFLVNVSVLTTGFDAPHVDLIAILRPTESVGLYQQIIGRGLRLSKNKEDCLILDYTGLGHNIFSPEIEEVRPCEDSEIVQVICPSCGHENDFWGKKSEDGFLIEHYGRKCKGAFEDTETALITACNFRFRFKICEDCGSENDIAARTCQTCKSTIVDTDKKLKEAMQLKDAHIMRPDSMMFEKTVDKKGKTRLEISYYDFDANSLKEYYYLDGEGKEKAFYYQFTRVHTKVPGKYSSLKNIDDVIKKQDQFRMPMFIIARKKKYFWEIREKIFS